MMKLRMKQITFLLAGLGASALTFAAPVTPEEIEAVKNTPNLDQAWISGATAPTSTVYEGWVRGCDEGTNTVFTTQAATSPTVPGSLKPGSIGNFSAYACKRSDKISVLYHTLDGGSLNAYTPHTIGTALSRIKFVGAGSGCNTTTNFNWVDPTNSRNNARVYKNCFPIGAAVPSAGPNADFNRDNKASLAGDLSAPQWPTGGFSDVEAALFTAGIGAENVRAVGQEANVGIGQVFGVVVSIPLYREMQRVQGIPAEAVDAFDPAKAPNITSGQYANLISTATSASWQGLLGRTATNPNSSKKVNIFRRVNTSGSQASSNVFFLRNPCNNALTQNLLPRSAISTATLLVSEESGSGSVKTKITTAGGAGDYAIGVVSAENDWRLESTANAGYRYLKLDGVHPEGDNDTINARKTAAEGNYKFYMEMKRFTSTANPVGLPVKTTFENNILADISRDLNTPPANTCQVFPRGLTLTTGNTICNRGVEVAKMTNDGRNCQVPIQFF